MTNSRLTPEILATVAGLGSREAAAILSERLGFHVGKSTVNDARRKFGAKARVAPAKDAGWHRTGATPKMAKIEDSGNGSLIVETQDSVPQTRQDVLDRMAERGFDPEQYTISYRFSEWEAQTKDGVQTLYAARAGAVEKATKAKPTVSYDDLVAVIERNLSQPRDEAVVEAPPHAFVFNFADPQIGKTDINGGTHETIKRFMTSLDHACALLENEPASQIIWADLGDGIENFCNTSSQRQTNDLNLVEQVRVLRRLQIEGITRLMQYGPVVHVSVPSNHAQNRVGFQQPASTAHDDWGLEVQEQLKDAMLPRVPDGSIEFLAPEQHLESVAYTTVDGTRLGFVHGHRANSQDGLERWWAGQSLGRQPTHDADILLVGHFHNLSVRSVGKDRYIITTPSLDGGSSWFTVSRGNSSTAGVLTFRTQGAGRQVRDMIQV